MSGLADRISRRTRPPRPFAVSAVVSTRARLFGLGSVFGMSLRDSRRALLIAGFGVGMFVVFVAAQVLQQFPGVSDRLALAAQMQTLPPLFRGLLGEPIALDTLGGFISWRLLNFMPVMLGVWSIVALSGTLASEAKRGSLDLLATTPLSRTRLAGEKVLAHVVALAIAMLTAAVMTWLATLAFGTLEGDAVGLDAALSHMLWLGLATLAPGTVGFAVAAVAGRGVGLGAGAAVLASGYIINGYRDTLPAFEAAAPLSYFAWTAGHRPLAGVSDWPSLLVLAVVVAGFLVLGVALFVRRDIGRTASIGIALPRLRLGLREPFGRSFADRLAAATWWAIGVGAYGFVVALSAEEFARSLSGIPQIGELIERFYPGVDFRTAQGILQLTFFGFGILLISVAAAALVGGWASDEGEGRLDLVLTTPVSRIAWAARSSLGVLASIAYLGVLTGVIVGLGSAIAGGSFVQPFTGSLVAATYGAGLAGIGLAVGGLVRTALAAPIVAAVGVAFYLLTNLGPALGLPDEVVDLALNAHLGQPMVGTFDVVGLAISMALAAGGAVLAAIGFARRDIER